MKPKESQATGSSGLTGKQAKVLALLVAGSTIDAAAKLGRIDPATVHQWMKKDTFKQAYRDALADVIGHASGQLKASCGIAIDTLRKVANDENAPAAPRVSAARAILELCMKAIELDELAGRIEVLESLQELP